MAVNLTPVSVARLAVFDTSSMGPHLAVVEAVVPDSRNEPSVPASFSASAPLPEAAAAVRKRAFPLKPSRSFKYCKDNSALNSAGLAAF